MKFIATLILGMCVMTAALKTNSVQSELVFGEIEVGATETSKPCFSKKISGKISPLPRMKCRIS